MELLNRIYEFVVIGGIVVLFLGPVIARLLCYIIPDDFYKKELEEFRNAVKQANIGNRARS